MVSLGCEDFIGGKFIDGIWRAPSRVGLGVVFRVESFDESTVPVFFLFLNSVERLGCCLPAAGCDSWSACCVSAGDSTRENNRPIASTAEGRMLNYMYICLLVAA